MKAEKIVCPHCGAPVGGIQPGKLYQCEYCGITCIEGNKGEAVGYRSIPVGWGYIRGYAAPK